MCIFLFIRRYIIKQQVLNLSEVLKLNFHYIHFPLIFLWRQIPRARMTWCQRLVQRWRHQVRWCLTTSPTITALTELCSTFTKPKIHQVLPRWAPGSQRKTALTNGFRSGHLPMSVCLTDSLSVSACLFLPLPLSLSLFTALTLRLPLPPSFSSSFYILVCSQNYMTRACPHNLVEHVSTNLKVVRPSLG